jgi:hypothetical protein
MGRWNAPPSMARSLAGRKTASIDRCYGAAVSGGAVDRVRNKPTTPAAQLKLWPGRVSSARRSANARLRPHALLKKCLVHPPANTGLAHLRLSHLGGVRTKGADRDGLFIISRGGPLAWASHTFKADHLQNRLFVRKLTFPFAGVRYVAPPSFWSPGTPKGAGGLGTRPQRDGAVAFQPG